MFQGLNRRGGRGFVAVLRALALGEDQLRGLVQRLGSVVGLLQEDDVDERRQFYQELGLNLIYQRLDGREKVKASLGVEFSRVGGGTWYKTPRRVGGADLWLPAA